MSSDLAARRSALEQRRDHVQRDLTELADQVNVGEIDASTAARLETGYRAELTEIGTALAELEEGSDGVAASASVSTRRAFLGVVALVAAFTVAIAFIEGDTVPSQQGAAVGVDATPRSAPTPAATLDGMEQAAAADPDNVGLRLAVAGVYFQLEEFSASLSHYLAVLEANPTPRQESIALGRVGWMAFITGQVEAADSYLRRSLEADPANVEGRLFLGRVRLFGFDDPEGGIPLLEDVLADPDLSAEMRAEVQQMLEIARSMQDAS